MATRMQQRRGTAAEWSSVNPVLTDGEIGFERDTGLVKVGDGVKTWSTLPQPFVTKSGGDTVTASGAGIIPLRIKLAAGQTANGFDIRNSSDVNVMTVDSGGSVRSAGRIVAGSIGTPDSAATMQSQALSASEKAFVARGFAGQTANIAEFQNSSGAVLTRIASNGTVTTPTGSALGTSGNVFVSGGSAFTPLSVKGTAGQTATLAEFLNSAGTVLATITSDGGQQWGTNTSYIAGGPAGAAAFFGSKATGQPGLVVKGFAGQTANLSEFMNSGGSVLAQIDSGGGMQTSGSLKAGSVTADYVAMMQSTVPSGAGGIRGFVVRGAAGQTANLAEFQNNAGTATAYFGPSGRLSLSTGGSFAENLNSRFAIETAAVGEKGLVVRGAAAQTANLSEFQNSAGSVLAGVTSDGAYALGPIGAPTGTSAYGRLFMDGSGNLYFRTPGGTNRLVASGP